MAGTGDLLEREDELDAVGEVLGSVTRGLGGVVLLRGPGGIGKSRLLAAACEQAAAAGLTVLRASGGELERDFAFGVARQLFEPALTRLPAGDRAAVMVGAAGLAAPVVLMREHAAGPLRGDRLFAVIHGLYWLCANLASRSPLAIAVDDVQWADEQTVQWLAYLARRASDMPVLVLLAARDDADAPAPASLLELAAGRDDPRPGAQAAHQAGGHVPRRTRARRRAREAVVERLPRAQRRQPVRPARAGGRARRIRHRAPTVRKRPHSVAELLPGTVARAVLHRLTRLPDPAIALARATAVLGSDVHLADAAQLAGLSDREAADAMDALVDSGFLAPRTPLCFVHPLMREAIYDDIPVGRRLYDHRRAADVLTERIAPERIAAHLLQCEPRGDQAGVAILRRCAERAVHRGAPATAVRYLLRALDEPPGPDVRGVLLRELGTVEARVGRLEAVEHLEEALRTATAPADVARCSRELAVAMAARGDMDEAAAALERGIQDLAGRDREMDLRLEGELGALGQLHLHSVPRVAARLRKVAPDLTGATPGERLVLASYAHLRSTELAPADEVLDIAERAVAGGALLREQTADSPVFYLLVYAFFRAERADLSDHWLAAALDEARLRGSVLGTSSALAVRAQLSWLRGQLADAEADAQASMDAQVHAGWASVLPLAVAVLAECRLERGDPAAAAAIFEETGLGGDLPEMTMFRWAQASRGRARLASGDPQDGLGDLLGCRGGTLGSRADIALLWRTDAALALHARGDTAQATAPRRTSSSRLAREANVARPLGVALRTAALLAQGQDQERRLHEAVAVLAPSSARLEHARVLVDLGACVRRAGRRAEAREHLRAGYELARQCGSTALTDRATEELAAAGVRLRRPALSGADALTPSERRVAGMAVQGMSNPEIAQALFVTRKTIEMHLGRVYRKLGVTGREQLAAALAPRPDGKEWGPSPLSGSAGPA